MEGAHGLSLRGTAEDDGDDVFQRGRRLFGVLLHHQFRQPCGQSSGKQRKLGVEWHVVLGDFAGELLEARGVSLQAGVKQR